MAHSAHRDTSHQPLLIAEDALLNVYERMECVDDLLSALIADQMQQVATDLNCENLQGTPCGADFGHEAVRLPHCLEVVHSWVRAPASENAVRVADKEMLTEVRLLRSIQRDLHAALNATTCLLIEASLPVGSPITT